MTALALSINFEGMSFPVVARTAAVAAILLAWAGALWAHGPKRKSIPPSQITAEEKAAFQVAKPVLEKHCFRCHTSARKRGKGKGLKHLSFDRYPPMGHHSHEAGAAVRRVVVGTDEKGPTMPSDDPGAVTGEELKAVLEWADAYERARARNRRPDDGQGGAPAHKRH